MKRSAFTVVELLVLLAIIGLLMALILPALQRVRAVADRIMCASRLRQIGLALHHYHNDYARLPEGVISGFPYNRMTWMTKILPYIEQDQLWSAALDSYSKEPVPFFFPAHVALATPIKLYCCPSDERMGIPHISRRIYYTAHTSYLGCLGTNALTKDGCLFVDSKIRLTDIHDGTSNTILAGERPPSPDMWYGWWYASYGQLGTGSCDVLLGTAELNLDVSSSCPPGPYSFKAGAIDNQCSVLHYWSLHQNGAHFLFGDGSVHFLTYSAAPILPALGTRSGREHVELP